MSTNPDNPRRLPGRPPKLDVDLTKRVCDIVRGGNYIETACASVGIDRITLYAWMREGAAIRRHLATLDDDAAELYLDSLSGHLRNQLDFSHAVEKANAEAETIAVLRVSKAGADGAWQADMTRLERRHPKRWGRREAVEVSGQLDGVRVDADTPQEAVAASKALQNARARLAAADLIEALADTPSATDTTNHDGDDDDEQPETDT